MKKIIVAHPEKQHSYRMADAINDMGALERYVTTVYYKKYNLTYWFDKLTRGKIRLNKIRKHEHLLDEQVEQHLEARGLLLLILRRVLKRPKVINWIQNKNFDRFGEKVAKLGKRNASEAVVLYDTNALQCFRELKGTGIVRIMDTSIANRAYTKHIYESLIQSEDEWTYFSEKDVLLDEREMKRLEEEIRETDHFLVPSNFVKRSLEYSGVASEQIHIVPYGVDVNLFEYSKRRADVKEGPLRLLFVGQCSYRKGLQYLSQAVSERTEEISLTIVGGYQEIPELYEKYAGCKNIEFCGRVQHDELPAIYKQADVFVLPSLSEGMSLVGLEAMASGLPLLCSKNCGVNDVVVEEENGWILEEISVKALLKKMDSINAHRDVLQTMGEQARKTAEGYTWDAYKRNMQKTIKQILGE